MMKNAPNTVLVIGTKLYMLQNIIKSVCIYTHICTCMYTCKYMQAHIHTHIFHTHKKVIPHVRSGYHLGEGIPNGFYLLYICSLSPNFPP